ncbi:hypothetical protein M413DRAFT_23486 [Hebeloma cylindrosporum]|uniref:Uncharacterized protein n=1 Tax=Hebeloma cylindrosporum TaxID=76867 RepID=A0A0C2Z227_HEBCY|nr:hypothetical protein M413DRAFT_23486 [Hebeloma cylindrosporum h7]
MSLAKHRFPNWSYPQEALPSVSRWPWKLYEALPAGDGWCYFYNILALIGEPFPPTEGDDIFDISFTAKVFNEIYDRTGGLIVETAMGAVAESVDDVKSRQPIVVLGLPDEDPTDEQKRIVAELMGLMESDVIQVYIFSACTSLEKNSIDLQIYDILQMSLAKQHFPHSSNPQEMLPPLGSWPDQIYEALPAGADWEKIYNILTNIGEPIPPTTGVYSMDLDPFGRAFSAVYDLTEGLVINQALGTLVDSTDNPVTRQKFEVMVLGLPNRPPTEDQKKIVAELMGLKVFDVVKVYVSLCE